MFYFLCASALLNIVLLVWFLWSMLQWGREILFLEDEIATSEMLWDLIDGWAEMDVQDR